MLPPHTHTHTHTSGSKPRVTLRWPDGWHTPVKCDHRPSHARGWTRSKTAPEK